MDQAAKGASIKRRARPQDVSDIGVVKMKIGGQGEAQGGACQIFCAYPKTQGLGKAFPQPFIT